MLSAFRHKTYTNLCKDPEFNPLGSGEIGKRYIAEIYQAWNPMIDEPKDSEELWQDIDTDFRQGMIGGVLTFVRSDDADFVGKATVIHNIQPHAARGSDLYSLHFGYVGDVEGQDIDLVCLPTNIADTAYNVRVLRSVDQHVAMLGTHEEIIGPFTATPNEAGQAEEADENEDEDQAPAVATDPAYELVTTRKSMFIPYQLMPYLLRKPAMGPGTALRNLLPILVSLDLLETCKPLVDFLKVASTAMARTGLDATNEPVSAVCRSLAGEHVNGMAEVLNLRRKEVLYRQLPALAPKDDEGAPALQAICGAMREVKDGLLSDLSDRRAARQEEKQETTIEQRWRATTVQRLLTMCNAANVEDLPFLYHRLAAHKKTEGTVRSVLQECVDDAGYHLDIDHVPVVSVQHATALNGWIFFGASDQSLGEGLMPFSVVPPNQVSAAAVEATEQAHQQNMDYNTIMTGSTSITSTDASKMRGGKGYIPNDFEEMVVQLEAYTCLLAAILGRTHPNVIEHKTAVKKVVRNRARLKLFLTQKYGTKLGAAMVVYYFQLRHKNWFREAWSMHVQSTPPSPRLQESLDHFAVSHNVESWVPDVSGIQALAKLRPTSTAGGSSSGTGGGAASDNGGNATNQSNGNERRRVTNRGRDLRVMGETPLAKRIRDKSIREALETAGEDPPATAAGTTRCLSWHLKGKCYSDCPRGADHITLSLGEADKLVEWCKRAYP